VKGITFAGTKECEVADEEKLKNLIKAIAQKGKESPVTEVYQKLGTPMQVKVTNAHQCFPTRYWQSGRFSGWETICADYMQANFEVKAHGCPNCFLRCTKNSRIKNGRHAGLEIEVRSLKRSMLSAG